MPRKSHLDSSVNKVPYRNRSAFNVIFALDLVGQAQKKDQAWSVRFSYEAMGAERGETNFTLEEAVTMNWL